MIVWLFRLWRLFPLLVGLIVFLRRGKKNDSLADSERDELQRDIEALTTLAESGESDQRKDVARETAERLRAALARQQINKGALKDYRKRREALGETITAYAASDKRYDRKLRDLQDAAGKLAGG